MNSKSDFDFGFFEMLNHVWMKLKVKDPNSQFPISGRVKSYFELCCSYFLVIIIEKITLDRMLAALMLEEWINIITTFSYTFFSFVPSNPKPGRVLWDFNKKNLIDSSARWTGSGINFGKFA